MSMSGALPRAPCMVACTSSILINCCRVLRYATFVNPGSVTADVTNALMSSCVHLVLLTNYRGD